MFKILCLSLFVSCSLAVKNECNNGAAYWCQNVDTATECGVLEYCKLNHLIDTDNNVKPVSIELYFESLCPGCRQFILTQLYPTFKTLEKSGIMDIKLYPYGNAAEKEVSGKWKFTCQHGEAECEGNLIESCALHMLSHPSQFMPFIHCFEEEPTVSNAQACAKNLDIEWGPIASCYNSSEGNYLEHQMAVATESLNPSHQYVPWIIGNGNPHTTSEQNRMQNNLLKYVCNEYTGTKPSACTRVEESRCFK